MTGGPISGYGDAKTLGSTAAEELWKKAPEEAEPRPLQIQYSIEDVEDMEGTDVSETVFEDPSEAELRPRLLVPLQSVLGLKALCEREYIRTEAVTELLSQCRTAYYKELLYLREQLILAAEPEKQMMLAAVQNYEVYFFNPPAYVDEDLKEYMLNCSRWTHKKLIEENYELQMKLSGQNDVFENADFCLKGLLRRHGTYKLFTVMHSVVKNVKDLFNPEDMARKDPEAPKPLEELEAAVNELFPNRGRRDDNSGPLLNEISELQKTLTETKAELARIKALLDSERSRAEGLAKKCDDHERRLSTGPQGATSDQSALQELTELFERMQQEADAQAERLTKMVKDLAAGKTYELGRSRPDRSKVFPKLDEAILDLDKLFAKIAKESPQIVQKIQADSGSEEISQLKQEVASLKAKLMAAEQREQDALAKLKELQKRQRNPDSPKMPESPSGGSLPDDVGELKRQLERKIAKVAELEAELDQAKRDLRTAQRTIDEKDLLLQERARKDADKAKHLSELMEKLRKSEEEAEKLGVKLIRAEDKIKQLKEQIRALKNQLGLKHEESEEEVEEEVDTTQTFLSRYYLRAKNSGKPRWMLLSEDAKYKTQRRNEEGRAATAGTWTSSHHQPQDPNQAFQFLRKPHGAGPAHGTMVRLQYSFTQGGSLGDPGLGQSMPDPASPSSFQRMNSFQGVGQLQQNQIGSRSFADLGQLDMPASPSSFQRMNSFQGVGQPGHLQKNQSGSRSFADLGVLADLPASPSSFQRMNSFQGLGQPGQLQKNQTVSRSADGQGKTSVFGTATSVADLSAIPSFQRINSLPGPSLAQVLRPAASWSSSLPTSPPRPGQGVLEQSTGMGRTSLAVVTIPGDMQELEDSLPLRQHSEPAQPRVYRQGSLEMTGTVSNSLAVVTIGDMKDLGDSPVLKQPSEPPLQRLFRQGSLEQMTGTGSSSVAVVTIGDMKDSNESAESKQHAEPPQPRAPVQKFQHARTTPDLSTMFEAPAKGTVPEAPRRDAVDVLMENARSQPLGPVKRDAQFLSWGPRPKINGSLPLTNCKGKMRPMVARSSSTLESPQYIQADSVPRLPGGKVRKATQPASWLTPLTPL